MMAPNSSIGSPTRIDQLTVCSNLYVKLSRALETKAMLYRRVRHLVDFRHAAQAARDLLVLCHDNMVGSGLEPQGGRL